MHNCSKNGLQLCGGCLKSYRDPSLTIAGLLLLAEHVHISMDWIWKNKHMEKRKKNKTKGKGEEKEERKGWKKCGRGKSNHG